MISPFFTLPAALLCFVSAYAEIIGTPAIKCNPDGFAVNFNMSSEFSGAIYLRGRHSVEDCRFNFKQNSTMKPNVEFSFEKCHARRKREVSPAGLTMSSVLVVSHHPTLVTWKDVAYDVQCFYKQHDVSAVHLDMNVSQPELPVLMSAEQELPKCEYRVEMINRTDIITVGDTVTHIWSCGPDMKNSVYCMQVHSCTANDEGIQENVKVVDERGCSVNRELLSDVQYDGMKATATSRVFKFADHNSIQFHCQISMTLKGQNENAKCSVPTCSSPLKIVQRRRREASARLDVDSQLLTVIEGGRVEFLPPKTEQMKLELSSCSQFTVPLLIVSTCLFLFCLFLSCFVCNTEIDRKRKEKLQQRRFYEDLYANAESIYEKF